MTGDKDRPSLASSDGTLWDEFKAAGWHDVIRDQITNFPGRFFQFVDTALST